MNRDEVRRLEKAAREKDKRKLTEWAQQFEAQISESLRRIYEKEYQDELQCSVDNFLTAIAFTLHFSEDTNYDKEKLPDVINDLLTTVDMFRTGEYKPQDYKDELRKDGIEIDVYDYSRIYRDKMEKLDNLIKEYDNKIKEYTKRIGDLDNSNNSY